VQGRRSEGITTGSRFEVKGPTVIPGGDFENGMPKNNWEARHGIPWGRILKLSAFLIAKTA
jgi:hypothetical protein